MKKNNTFFSLTTAEPSSSTTTPAPDPNIAEIAGCVTGCFNAMKTEAANTYGKERQSSVAFAQIVLNFFTVGAESYSLTSNNKNYAKNTPINKTNLLKYLERKMDALASNMSNVEHYERISNSTKNKIIDGVNAIAFSLKKPFKIKKSKKKISKKKRNKKKR